MLLATLAAATEQIEIIETEQHRILKVTVPTDALPRLQLRWLDDAGNPLQNFAGLKKQLQRQGETLRFATNAGIYERGPRPCGLTMNQGEILVPLNLAEGEGNFYLQPNGVFFIDSDGARILRADEMPQDLSGIRLATQSGPLLLREGQMHPRFQQGSSNLRQRSGVGVRTSDGAVIFAMTDRDTPAKRRINFHDFAAFFLAQGCQDALFLDGDISEFTTQPEIRAGDNGNTFAAMLVWLQ